MAFRASRPVAVLVALALASTPLPVLAQPAAAQAAAAQTEIAAGDKAARTKDFAAALTHYQTAQLAAPSWRAEMGVGDALYHLGRAAEAYEAYNEVQATYGAKLGGAEKALVSNRLKELGAKTGWLSIRTAENGAEVDVDGKSFGVTPIPVLVRVLIGSHEVQVKKAGFATFAGHADVVADGTAIVEVKLAPAASLGHVVVHTNGAEPLRVIVDGVDVGATPWEGDLPLGTHTISGRSSSAQAEAQTVELTAGSRTTVDLISSVTAAHLQVRTSDGKGSIYVDGVIKGEGAFSADLAPGPHSFAVSRDGYQRYEKSMTLGERQTVAETVTLEPVAAAGATSSEGERAVEGLYGGFGFLGAFGIGGMGTELATNCADLGASSCSTPSPIGGGAFGYLGYTFDPVGFELFLAGMGDEAKQTATYNGQGSSATSGPILPASTPARTEAFTFARGGGLAAVRARATFQTRRLRGTVAGGVGVSYREMFMKRTASDAAGDSNNYVPSPVGYFSPAISAEGALQYRVTPTIAISVGILLWADSASIAGSNSSPAKANLPFGSGGTTIPTPEYHLATGPQVTIGPIVGLAFGP